MRVFALVLGISFLMAYPLGAETKFKNCTPFAIAIYNSDQRPLAVIKRDEMISLAVEGQTLGFVITTDDGILLHIIGVAQEKPWANNTYYITETSVFRMREKMPIRIASGAHITKWNIPSKPKL